MTRAASALLIGSFALAACGNLPRDGEPCRPGDGFFARPRNMCMPTASGSGYEASDCAISCTGPSGCEGPVEFRWSVEAVSDRPIVWCGCDGRTHSNDLYPVNGEEGDFFTEPTTRWQWYGSCEDPCRELRGELWLGRYPPHPRCHDCDGAEEVDGRCRASDGFAVADTCCS